LARSNPSFLSIDYEHPEAIRAGVEQGSVNGIEQVSVNGIDIFLLKAQDAAWLANYEWNIRGPFIT